MSGFPLSFITNQILNIKSTDSENTVNVKDANSVALLDLLDNLSSGETILGKIISSDENSYTFKTPDNVLVNAKAEHGISLEPGSSVLFEVNKTTTSNVSLRPLNINTNTSHTAVAALEQAGIPVNARSLEFTVRNMEYGNPIDRKSLVEGYRDVVLNEDIPVKYIVDLQNLKIPRTVENLNQYKAYINTENTIAEGLSEVIESVNNDLAEYIVANGSDTDIQQMKDALSTINNENMSQNVLEIKGLSEFVNAVKSVLPKGEIANIPQQESVKDDSDKYVGTTYSAKENDLQTEDLEVLQDINKGFSKTPDKPENSNLYMQSKEHITLELKPIIKDIFTKIVQNNYFIPKEAMGEKSEVKDLYERLYSDSKHLVKELSDIAPKDTPSYVQVQNLSSNIDFMSALNNFVPYVQIPFAGVNGNKTGELYIFKNKRSLTSKESELTAFVHLDTDNLGPADVYVSLRDNNVSTHFMLENEESLDFIEKNLPFLSKRLTEKGYSFSGDVKLTEDSKSSMEKMLEASLDKMMIAKTSFDARV